MSDSHPADRLQLLTPDTRHPTPEHGIKIKYHNKMIRANCHPGFLMVEIP